MSVEETCGLCGCPEDRHIMDDGSCVRPVCDCPYYRVETDDFEDFEERE